MGLQGLAGACGCSRGFGVGLGQDDCVVIGPHAPRWGLAASAARPKRWLFRASIRPTLRAARIAGGGAAHLLAQHGALCGAQAPGIVGLAQGGWRAGLGRRFAHRQGKRPIDLRWRGLGCQRRSHGQHASRLALGRLDMRTAHAEGQTRQQCSCEKTVCSANHKPGSLSQADGSVPAKGLIYRNICNPLIKAPKPVRT